MLFIKDLKIYEFILSFYFRIDFKIYVYILLLYFLSLMVVMSTLQNDLSQLCDKWVMYVAKLIVTYDNQVNYKYILACKYQRIYLCSILANWFHILHL